MRLNATKNMKKKVSNKKKEYLCDICDYLCYKKFLYAQHLKTKKHIFNENATKCDLKYEIFEDTVTKKNISKNINDDLCIQNNIKKNMKKNMKNMKKTQNNVTNKDILKENKDDICIEKNIKKKY